MADIVLRLLSFVAETKRQFIRQRKEEGIAAAKQRGVKFGGVPKERSPEFENLKSAYQNEVISARYAANQLGICHRSFLNRVNS